MGIVSYGRTPGFPKSSRKLESKGKLPLIKTSHQDSYDILVDSEDDIGDALLDALPFLIGDPFENGFTRLTAISVDRNASARLKHVASLTYEEIADEDQPNEQPPDQLQPDWSWTFETLDRALTEDVDGNPVVNSAGEVIELVGPVVIPILHIERYKETFDPNTILNYANHRNSSSFWGADPGLVLMAGIEDRKDTKVVYTGKYYRRVSYVLKFAVPIIVDSLEGWTDLVLDRGTYYLDASNKKVHFKAGGSDITGNLDGSGGELADDTPPYILRFNKFPEAEFNDLDLGPFI